MPIGPDPTAAPAPPAGRAARAPALATAVVALALCLALAALQLSFFRHDRTPMTWDPSLHHHLSLRLLDAVREHGASALLRVWTQSEHLYPPLYAIVHLPVLALAGPSPRAAQATEGLWLALVALTVFFAAARDGDRLRAAALALACATSPLLLALSRVTYIENLLTLEVACAALLARRWSRDPGLRDAGLFGVVAGAALLTKWSAAVFLAPIVVASLLAQRARPAPAGAGRLLRSLALAALPALAIAAPWYLSDPLRLSRSLTFESFEKVESAAFLSWDGAGFYLRALAAELFWLPVAALLVLLLASAWRRSDPAARRFWALSCLGALAILTAVPHRQSRFAAALVPLLLLALAELAPARRWRPAHTLLVGLAALSGVALSLPAAVTGPAGGFASPTRGIPQLFLGQPNPQAWPHDEVLFAAAAAVRARGSNEPAGPVRLHLTVERGHPYLNRWTFQSHAWQAGVTLVANPANAHLLLVVDRAGNAPSPLALASFDTPDGYRCTLLPP